MASPIPTQLSPGVKVSEIDLSQFVQPESLNSAGMVGSFNWGPCLKANRITSESSLASIYGKPTLDPSDVASENDFLSAANFLRYSNNLKVIRILQANDANSTSLEAGITAISSCDIRKIKNEEEFRQLGGFSGNDGIESVAHFRGRYPGNFGDSLKVIVWDGATGESVGSQTSTQYFDYPLAGGYNLASMSGISSGTIGYTLTALSSDTSGSITTAGITSGSHPYFIVTIAPPVGKNAFQFIEELSQEDAISFLYATGTTSANLSLSSSDPSGNNSNYYVLEDVIAQKPFNPFYKFNPSGSPTKNIFAKRNPTNTELVDILFLNADDTNMNSGVRTNAFYPGTSKNKVTSLTFTTSGVPSHFAPLIYNQSNFLAHRSTWSNIADSIFDDTTGIPTIPSIRGWALLVGITGGITFGKTIDGTMTAIGLTFDSVGGLSGIQRDFAFGMKQFGYRGTVTSQGRREDYGTLSIFDKTPGTSEYASDYGGSNDELSVAIIDTDGKFQGVKNSVLERFELLSKATDAKNLNGESTYYKDYINNNSKYVYMTKPFGLSGGGSSTSKADTAFGDLVYSYVAIDGKTYTRKGYYESQLSYGESSSTTPSNSEYSSAYSIFADDDSAVDILFVPESSVSHDGLSDPTVVESIVYDTVIEPRKDTVLVIPTPPPQSLNQHSSETATRLINFRNTVLTIPSNSYTMLVAGRKTYFDTFNNQIRKMSLSSDLAGILSSQEIPWESPAGFARGNIKNAIKLETNFSKQDRDELYKNGLNFFVQFNDGSGTVLFGDKTLLKKPSAFDRINVRRVFIALEKAIAKAAKYSLFEFNDEFTRSQFRNLTIPFLSNVQAQRGIADFKVVCDETNNTAEVIDRNQFVADIYIKPLKSINFIQLNFVAVRSDFNLTTIE